MTLKDWKKRSRNHWYKQNGNIMNPFTNLFIENDWRGYIVRVNNKDLNINEFKKYSQALSFAKSYMRTH